MFGQSVTYNAIDFQTEFGALFADGVCTGGAVLQHGAGNMSVDVNPLTALKAGLFILNDALFNVQVNPNASGYNRIDLVACDMDNNTIVVVQGTPSSSPTPPVLTGNKLPIAQVLVGNGVGAINTGAITDIRYYAGTNSNAVAIPLNADLNTYQKEGFYACVSGTIAVSLLNLPAGVTIAFSLLVEKHSGNKQTLTVYSATNYSTFIRNGYAGVWGAWVQVLNIDGSCDMLDGKHGASYWADTDITQSLGTSGWLKLKNGALFQWGNVVVATSAGVATSFSITWPVSFPAECDNVQMTIVGKGTSASSLCYCWGANAPTVSGLANGYVYDAVAQNDTVRYYATGK